MAVGKARVLGSSAKIKLVSGTNTCDIGEVDKFTAKQNSEVKKSKPLGSTLNASQAIHNGWDLTFEGGKVDWNLAALFLSQERQYANGGRSPYFEVIQTVKFSDATSEVYRYADVTIHDFNEDMNGADDEIGNKFSGFAAYRELDASSGGSVTTAVASAHTTITNLLTQMTNQKPGAASLSDVAGTSITDATSGLN